MASNCDVFVLLYCVGGLFGLGYILALIWLIGRVLAADQNERR